jgi:transposase
MFFPEQQVRVFLYGAPVDMRRSFDGLYAIARHGMQADPLAGHLRCTVNHGHPCIKQPARI